MSHYSSLPLIALLLSPLPLASSFELVSSFVSIGVSCRHNHQHQRHLTNQIIPSQKHCRKRIHHHFYQTNAILQQHTSCAHTQLFSSISHSQETDCDELKQILRRYGFGSRIITLSDASLSENPMPAELYEGGSWKMCLILGLKPPSSSKSGGNAKPPLLDVLAMRDGGLFEDRKVVDIGQITTLWQDFNNSATSSKLDELTNSLQSSFNRAQESLQNNIFPIEQAMQNVYNGRVANRSRPPSHNNRRALTKKQIPKIASQFSNPAHLEELLRSLLKVGEGTMSRLVDSALATDYLYSDYCQDGDDEQIIRRIVAAQVLTEDAIAGGRFKRRSCQFVSAQCNINSDSDSKEVQELTLVNGGWIAVDPSIKAASEGRKFAAATSYNSNESNSDNTNSKPIILTAADERIAHRLECLAMGDVWKSDSDHEEDEKMLELDVRAALASMDLPLTPQGATSALIKIGRWSENTKNDKDNKNKAMKKLIEPWSPDLLDAARSLEQYEKKRRELLAKKCFSSKQKSTNKAKVSLTDGLEGRMDLTSLPCVCIDAKRASFRDDSIGIRLRSSTGRRVNKAASKWEVLVHIADVSDLYFDGGKSSGAVLVPNKKDVNAHLLRQAAERRGQSRYDLPLGPLHLLPPVALTALSLVTNEDKTPNRCVTLWAYIDERNGKLLEAGVERTIISSPKALTFADATTLLDTRKEEVPKSMTNTKAILSVAERNLLLWSQRHQQRNEAAQKREKRLSTKELISNELNGASRTKVRDDGVGNSFQRSRGHRAVDASLDLYAFAVGTLIKRANQPVPRAAGSGADRGGRLATAPLRRYIDGLAQRQALSVLCSYGRPLTIDECREATKVAARANDNIANIRSSKQSTTARNNSRQVSALHSLARHLASTGGINNQQQVKAVSTGHNNEVVIVGAGATGRCKGVKGTLKPGEKLLVRVHKIDPEMGVLDVLLVR